MPWIRSALWIVALAGASLAPASARDLLWTPCNELAMSGQLQVLCQACAAKGMGWRFYLSRDGLRTDCRHDTAKTGPYRQHWMDEEERRVKKDERERRRAAIQERKGPILEKGSRTQPGASVQPSTGPDRSAWTNDEQARRDELRQRVPVPASPASIPRRDAPSSPAVASRATDAPKPAATPVVAPSPRREAHRSTQSRPPSSPALVPSKALEQSRSSAPAARQKKSEPER